MTHRGSLSERIVIVGGGFSGLAIATRLAQERLPVTVVEAAKLGFGASSRNQGWLYSGAWFAPRQRQLARLCYASFLQTVHFCPECLEPGHTGTVFFASLPETDLAGWKQAWKEAGIPFEDTSRQQLAGQLAGVNPEMIHAACILPDRSIRPHTLLQKLAETAADSGAEIHAETRVARINHDGEQVTGITTTKGEDFPASIVIMATGAIGSDLWEQLELDSPGHQSVYERVALRGHLVSVSPAQCPWPFAVVDAEGFNHMPHTHRDTSTSVFGAERWSVVPTGESFRPNPVEYDRLEQDIDIFLPDARSHTEEVHRWFGVTVQAMHPEQIEPGRIPLPTVIDHEHQAPGLRNLLSTYPGRATLWAKLAEDVRDLVLTRIERKPIQVATPPWEHVV